MRVFDDERGNRWQAATVFGSYGEARVVFSRVDADELRTAAMPDATLREAEQRLESFDEEALRTCLASAQPGP